MVKAEVETKVGRRLGDFFVRPLQEAKQRIWVMSPWISSVHVPMLIEKKTRGADVKVITTDNYTPTHREALKLLTYSEKEVTRPANSRLKWTGIILIIIGIVALALTVGISLIVSIVGYIIYRRGVEKFELRWVSTIGDENLIVYHTDPFRLIHAKVYVADDQVAFGSANLTKGGMNENLESLVWITEPTLANQIVEDLNLMEKKLGLRRVSLTEVAQAVWAAPTR